MQPQSLRDGGGISLDGNPVDPDIVGGFNEFSGGMPNRLVW